MRLNKYFDMREFVSPKTWGLIKKLPQDELIKKFYTLVKPETVKMAVKIREYFDAPMIINDWHLGGKHTQRGYRLPTSRVGAKKSQHKVGRAIDFNIKGLTSDEVYLIIIKDEELFYMFGARRMENSSYATTWTHIDTKETELENSIYIFVP